MDVPQTCSSVKRIVRLSLTAVRSRTVAKAVKRGYKSHVNQIEIRTLKIYLTHNNESRTLRLMTAIFRDTVAHCAL
jgi:hypothetical protein